MFGVEKFIFQCQEALEVFSTFFFLKKFRRSEVSYLKSFSADESAVFIPKETFAKAIHVALRPGCYCSSGFSLLCLKGQRMNNSYHALRQLVVPAKPCQLLLDLVGGIRVAGWLQFEQGWDMKCCKNASFQKLEAVRSISIVRDSPSK